MTNTAVGGEDGNVVEVVNDADATATWPADVLAEDDESAVSQPATDSTGTMGELPAALPSADPTEEPDASRTPSAAAACSESKSTEDLGLTRYGNPRTVPEKAGGDGEGLSPNIVTTDGTSRDAPTPALTIGEGRGATKIKIRMWVGG